VNVVTNAGPIFSGIVVPKDAQLCPFADYHFLDIREEIVGMHERFIAQQVALVRPTGIEVPQRYDPPIFMHFG